MAANDPLALLDRAISQTGAIVAGVRTDQAGLPTPCSEFDVRQLLNHMVYDVLRSCLRQAGSLLRPPGGLEVGEDDGLGRGAWAELVRGGYAGGEV